MPKTSIGKSILLGVINLITITIINAILIPTKVLAGFFGMKTLEGSVDLGNDGSLPNARLGLFEHKPTY